MLNFKWYVRNSRSNSRAREGRKEKAFNLDENYLSELWAKQEGVCPVTGWNLVVRTVNDVGKQNIRFASLDRIDHDKGYVKGNVRFVSIMYNLCRHRYTDTEVLEFCEAVTEHASK